MFYHFQSLHDHSFLLPYQLYFDYHYFTNRVGNFCIPLLRACKLGSHFKQNPNIVVIGEKSY